MSENMRSAQKTIYNLEKKTEKQEKLLQKERKSFEKTLKRKEKRIQKLEKMVEDLKKEKTQIIKNAKNAQERQLRKEIFGRIISGQTFSQIDESQIWSNDSLIKKDKFYDEMKRLDILVEKILKEEFEENSRLIIKWKQTNPQLSFVLAYDGRWSSRRNAQEGTVSFICKEGPNSLIDKLILSMTQRKKTHEESPIRSHFFEGSQDFKLGSSSMEGYSAKCAMRTFAAYKILPDKLVHDRDSSSFQNIMKIMNSENHQVEELFDPNHWFKNFTPKLIQFIQNSKNFKQVLKYQRMIQKFPRKLTSWLKFSRIESGYSFDKFKAMSKNAIRHWQGKHKSCDPSLCPTSKQLKVNNFLSSKNSILKAKVPNKKERLSLASSARKELRHFLKVQIEDARKIIHSYSTNIVESWNNTLTKMVPKNKNFWAHYTTRLCVAAIKWNQGYEGLLKIADRMDIEYKDEEKVNIRQFYENKKSNNEKNIKRKKRKEPENDTYYYKKKDHN